MFGIFTYSIFLTVWAFPILLLHWCVGASVLRAHLRVLATAVLLPTLYLGIADSIALRNGIWVLHGNRLLGIFIGNVPVEECAFFLVTNLLVAQSVLLVMRLDRAAFPALR